MNKVINAPASETRPCKANTGKRVYELGMYDREESLKILAFDVTQGYHGALSFWVNLTEK